MADPKQRPLVVIEDSLLIALANNAAARKEFPFLAAVLSAQPKKAGCGVCGRRSGQASNAVSAVKQRLASLDDVKKRKLTEILNATQVRITYKNGANIRQLTF